MHWSHLKSDTNLCTGSSWNQVQTYALVPVEIRYKPIHCFHLKSGTNLCTGSILNQVQTYALVPVEIRYKLMHWFQLKSGTNLFTVIIWNQVETYALFPFEIRYKPKLWFHSKSMHWFQLKSGNTPMHWFQLKSVTNLCTGSSSSVEQTRPGSRTGTLRRDWCIHTDTWGRLRTRPGRCTCQLTFPSDIQKGRHTCSCRSCSHKNRPAGRSKADRRIRPHLFWMDMQTHLVLSEIVL